MSDFADFTCEICGLEQTGELTHTERYEENEEGRGAMRERSWVDCADEYCIARHWFTAAGDMLGYEG